MERGFSKSVSSQFIVQRSTYQQLLPVLAQLWVT